MSSTPLHRIEPSDDPSNVVPLARAPVPEGPYQIDTSAINRRTLQRRWIVISMLCHLLVIGALLFGLVEAPQPVPPPVLNITLVPRGPGGEGAAGGNGGSGAKEAAAPAASPAPDKPDIPPPAPEQVAPQTPPQPEMPPPTPPQPEIPKPTPPSPEIPPPTPEPTRQPPPQTPPTPQPPQPMAVMPPPAALEPPPPPKPHRIPPRLTVVRHREPPREIVEATPAPNLMPVPSPAPAAAPAPAQAQTAAALATPGAGSGPGAKTGSGKGAEGIGKGAIGDGIGPGDDYLERLYRHLLRYKKYPPEAIGAKQQGSVIVGFTIARDGTVSNARIEKSSGSPSLDQATLALVRRASPAPPLPDSFKGSEARVKFPIDYKLSLIDQMF
ncbi:MAG TPA: energy transducer TonB [Stellaceae bacterium]|jgi:protein TonB|nr:energy transducer TonB [Stellaceae bacterium]